MNNKIKIIMSLLAILIAYYIYLSFFRSKAGNDVDEIKEPGVFSISENIQKNYKFEYEFMKEAPGTEKIALPGTVTYNLNNTAKIGSRVQGRIVGIFVNEGDYVKKNQNVVSIASAELGEMESRYKKAISRKESLKIQLDRAKELYDKKITSAKEYESTLMEYKTSSTEAENALNALRSFGLNPSEIKEIEAGKTYSLGLNIRSPISGTITERNAVLGQSVSVSENLFTVSDLSTVWVMLEVFEKDLNQVKIGQYADIIPVGNEKEITQAKVAHVGEVIDATTRSADIRLELKNSERKFRPGQSVSSFMQGTVARKVTEKKTYTLPDKAIHMIEGEHFAFIKRSDGKFQAKSIAIGKSIDNRIIVISGIDPQDEVVTEGSFILKSEFLKI
ncbi:MAG: efflux RND transporter periplasmic adaptor subunit [Leptospira sp.]|nr:efflux RND transporter periplasmic adaptor subunit [Leptospira sp.]